MVYIVKLHNFVGGLVVARFPFGGPQEGGAVLLGENAPLSLIGSRHELPRGRIAPPPLPVGHVLTIAGPRINVFAVQQNLMEDLTMDQDHEMTEHDRKLNPRPMVVTQEQLSNDLNARRQSTESTTRAGIGTNANRCGGGVGPPGPRVSTPTADFDPHAGGGGSILRESGSRTNYLSQMGSFMSLTGSTTVGGTGGGGGTASAAAASGAGARLSYGGGGAPGSVRDSGNSLLQGRDSAGGALGLPVRASESNSQVDRAAMLVSSSRAHSRGL